MTVPPVPHGDSSSGVPVSGADGHLPEEDVVLAALGEDLPAGATSHLRTCAACAAQVQRFRRIVDLARTDETVDLVPAPPGTWEAIAAATGVAPAASGTPAPPSGRSAPVLLPVPAPSPAPPPVPRGRRRAPRWFALAAALLVGAVGGSVGTRLLDDPTPTTPEVTVTASAVLDPLAGNGSGTADVVSADGHRRLELRVSDVAPAAGGILEVWLLDEDGGLVSLGTLSGDDLTVTLPDDIDLNRFSTVDVSREPLDGDPAHSSDSVLRGSLSERA